MPELRRQAGFVGKGVIACKYCGAEIFLQMTANR
jgi:hypothetical protein